MMSENEPKAFLEVQPVVDWMLKLHTAFAMALKDTWGTASSDLGALERTAGFTVAAMLLQRQALMLFAPQLEANSGLLEWILDIFSAVAEGHESAKAKRKELSEALAPPAKVKFDA